MSKPEETQHTQEQSKNASKTNTTTLQEQAEKAPKTDEGVTIQPMAMAWNMNQNQGDANKSIRKTKELLEQTKDQAVREMSAETKKAIGRMAIIAGPETLSLRFDQIKEGNQGALLGAMGGK